MGIERELEILNAIASLDRIPWEFSQAIYERPWLFLKCQMMVPTRRRSPLPIKSILGISLGLLALFPIVHWVSDLFPLRTSFDPFPHHRVVLAHRGQIRPRRISKPSPIPKAQPSPPVAPVVQTRGNVVEVPQEQLEVSEAQPVAVTQRVVDSRSETHMDANLVAKSLYLAQSLAKQGHYEQALQVVEDALQTHPQIAELYALRGSLQFKLGDYERAEASWMQAYQLDSSLTDVKVALEWVERKLGER